MAKKKHDREDLLREATGYVSRIEFTIPNHETVFCGIRDCGSVSVYWTQGDVLQFNASNELRRGFWRGRMIASYKQELHWLAKSPGRVQLQRIAFSSSESAAFLGEALQWLRRIQAAIAEGDAKTIGKIPEHGKVLAEINRWLAGLSWLPHGEPTEMPLAMHPGLNRA